MQQFEQLKYGHYYHIYNHSVGERDLFREPENYEYFLGLYDKYISPVANTYAWVLMPNHFHFLVRIKKEKEIVEAVTPDRVQNPVGDKVQNPVGDKVQNPVRDKVQNPVRDNIPSLQFSKLFNSYAQAFNKFHETRGALFERPFKRKLIDSDNYLRQVILYIHNNPIHHGFCSHPLEYAWSSYHTCTSVKPTKLKRTEVIEWFNNQSNFKLVHDKEIERDKIEGWLGL
jgi:putative transposase